MSSKLIMAIVATVVVLGVGAFLIFGSSGEEDSSTKVNMSSETTQSSFNELLAKGENARCTYDYTDESGNRSYGTAYFAGTSECMVSSPM